MNGTSRGMRRLSLALTLLLILFTCMTGRFAAGQGIVTGSITGSVADPTGAVIQGAAIQAVNIQTGARFAGTSQADGSFAFHDLPIGTYRLTITTAGFQTVQIPSIAVSVGQIVGLKQIALKVGAAETTVVEGQTTPLLNTTQSQVSAVFSEKEIPLLPLGGGSYDSLALLTPGVARTHSDNFSNTNGANFSANGDRGRSNNFELDGTNNNDNSIAGPQIFFHNPDALAEVQVITNNFSAQYGHNMGTVVNYITKSGTNDFHGSAYELYTGSWSYSLANQYKNPLFGYCASGQTTGCTLPHVPRQDINNFGGTLGGPILKNRLWFFGAGTGLRTRNGSTTYQDTSLFPTPNGLSELAADYPDNPAVAALKNDGPYGIGGGVVAPNSSKAQNVTVTDGTTSNSVEVAPFSRSLASISNEEEALGRLDYQHGTTDHIFLRYFYQDQLSVAGSGTVSTGGYVNVPDTAHSVGADWTHIFSSKWVDQLRYSFQETKLFFQGGGVPTCTGTNLSSCPASVGLSGGFASFGLATNLPQGREVKETEVQDNANWSPGHHSISFGMESLYQNSPNVFLPDYNGGYSYSSLSAMLEGTGSLTLGNGNVTIPFKETDWALYFQDDWKIRSNLTLNLGLRWEFFGQAVNLLHNETVAQQTGSSPFWATNLPLSVTTYPYTNPYYKNFEPRIGFNYAPTDKLVVRGGFAIGVDPAFYNIFLNSATAAPVINLGTFACGNGTGGTHQCLPGNGVDSADVRSLNLSQIPTGGNPGSRNYTTNPPNFRNPYSESYTLGIQYQILPKIVGEVRYVGVHGVKLFQSIDGNPNLAPVVAAFPGYYPASSLCNDPGQFDNGRVECGFSNVRSRGNTAFSIYNGLQLNLRTQDYHGLSGTFNYTWSRTIDNASEIFSTLSGGQTVAFPQNPLNIDRGERGQSGNNYPSVASIGVVYQVPGITAHGGLIHRLTEGFSVGAIYGYDSGQPYTPFQYRAAGPKGAVDKVTLAADATQSFCDGGSSSTGFNAAFNTYDVCRPILANPKAPLQTVGINTGSGYVDYYTGVPASRDSFHWLWNNQAEAIALGNPFPGVGRNTLRGQRWNNVDANIYKTTKLYKGASLQLQLNVFNLLNHAYIGTPDNYIEDYTLQGAYGINPFLNTALENSGNRSAQLGAKIIF